MLDKSPLTGYRGSTMKYILFALTLLVLVVNGPIHAAPPPGGEAIVRLTPETLKLDQPAGGSEQLVATDGPGFHQAVQVISPKRGNPWDAQFHLPIARPLAKGEVLLVHFWARMLKTRAESGVGTVEVTVQKASPGWDASINRTVNMGSEWQEFYFRGVSKADYAAGTMTLDFRCGAMEQTVECAGVEMLSYGNRLLVTDLPYTKSTYPGREAAAPWRAAAQARIIKYRTAPFLVRVLDHRGRPVVGAAVHVQMTRSAFDFGAALLTTPLIGHTPEDQIYQKTVLDNFNAGSFINALKWPAWIGEWGTELSRPNTMQALAWTKAHNLDFRGHVLVWPSWHNLPHAMEPHKEHPDRAATLAAVSDHIKDEVAATRGYLSEWDVINEPFDNHDLMDAYGRDIMVDWFREAHAAAPIARLSLNDYGILSSATDTAHEQSFEDNARYLLAQGAPITVLGLQGHFGDTPPGPVRVYALLNRYGKLGLKMRVTEYTVDTDDETLRADWTRDLMTVLYSHPGVIGFQCWTMQDLFDLKTGLPKPAGRAYQALALHAWHTDVTGKTSSAGDLQGQGYLGTYRITAVQGGKTVTKTVMLGPKAAPVVLMLP